MQLLRIKREYTIVLTEAEIEALIRVIPTNEHSLLLSLKDDLEQLKEMRSV